MTAKAVEPSQVIRLPMQALKEIFDENPDILVRVIQVIMIRLQRVIFTALRNYLGLYSELVQMKPHKDKQDKRASTAQTSASAAAAAAVLSNVKGSPTHHKRSTLDSSLIHTLSSELNDATRPDMLNDLSEVNL